MVVFKERRVNFTKKQEKFINILCFIVEMDKIDLKILRLLDKNARISLTQMARELRLSVQIVEYRLERMKEDGVLLGSRAVIDNAKWGYRYYKILLKFVALGRDQEEAWKKWVRGRGEVIWFGMCEGEWSAMVSVRVKNFTELSDFEYDLLVEFGALILQKEWLTVAVSHRFNRKFLYDLGKFVYELRHDFFTPAEYVGEKDQVLLMELAKDGRVRLTQLAEKVHLSAEAVGARLRTLVSRNIIMAYRPKINYRKFGLKNYELFLATKNPQVRAKIMEYYRQHARGDTIMELVGRYDLQVTVLLGSAGEFREVLADFRDRFGSDVMEYHPLTMYQEFFEGKK